MGKKPPRPEAETEQQPDLSEVKLGITAEGEIVEASDPAALPPLTRRTPSDEDFIKAMVDAAVGDNRSQFRVIGATERARELLAMLRAYSDVLVNSTER